jgi:hypothetical protein
MAKLEYNSIQINDSKVMKLEFYIKMYKIMLNV